MPFRGVPSPFVSGFKIVGKSGEREGGGGPLLEKYWGGGGEGNGVDSAAYLRTCRYVPSFRCAPQSMGGACIRGSDLLKMSLWW